jgi:hypothetical protein
MAEVVVSSRVLLGLAHLRLDQWGQLPQVVLVGLVDRATVMEVVRVLVGEVRLVPRALVQWGLLRAQA